MQQTTNYALKKIELIDSPPDITVINPNWDTIDTELKENEDALASHKAEDAVGAHNASNISVADPSNKLTATNVEAALLELFTFANNGKTAVANAVTAKGVSASPADTFSVLATKIGQISTGKRFITGSISILGGQTSLINTPFPAKVVVARQSQNGGSAVRFKGPVYGYQDGFQTYAGNAITALTANSFSIKNGEHSDMRTYDWYAYEE